mmetsp:Transcript_26225/g.38864  ORF Transcript_26225/g.38864 Transcript_26225/m.38864 type:complete len:750 (+) Transcript_26225:105-2354(+)
MISVEDYEEDIAEKDGNSGAQSVLDLIVPQSERIDFTNEISFVEQTLLVQTERVKWWESLKFTEIQLQLEDQALVITETREEYIRRRKALASSLRDFNRDVAGDNCSLSLDEVQQRIAAILDTFKKEFDFVANMCKSSEQSYLSLYKALREAPNPAMELQDSAVGLSRALEYLKLADARLRKMADEMAVREAEIVQRATPIDPTLILSNEEFQSRLKAELVEVKSAYDSEMRRREQLLRDSMEQQGLELQQRYDSLLAQNDAEIAALSERLVRSEEISLRAEEYSAMLDAESEKRSGLEDKLRTVKIEMEDLRRVLQERDEEIATLTEQSESIRAQVHAEKQARDIERSQYERNIEIVQKQLQELQKELQRRPPCDLNGLISRMGLHVKGEHAECIGSDGESQETEDIPWEDVERRVISAVRRLSTEATELRCRDQQRSLEWKQLTSELEALRRDAEESKSIVASLEKDLAEAHSSIEAGKALLRCHKIESGTRNVSGTTNSISSLSHVLGEDYDDEIKSTGNEIKGTGSELSFPGVSTGDSQMLRAVLEQRDRMMKLARSKEQEAMALQEQNNQLQREKNTLKDDNAELYTRLRVLRVNQIGVDSHSARESHGPTISQYQHHQGGLSKRRAVGESADDLESKYSQIYEARIDPFQLAELDRMTMLSGMNVFERSLAYVSRFVLQDKWMRHALLVYLILVHIFAIGYVIVVLNPELDQEIGAIESHWLSPPSSTNGAAQGEWEKHPDIE